MGFIAEFKEFAMKGNVIDMAVGVVIGGAFGKVVTSLVDNVIMPPIGMLMGQVDFKSLAVELTAAGADGKPVKLAYGMFINSVIDFTLVALSIFIVIKWMNTMNRKFAELAQHTKSLTGGS